MKDYMTRAAHCDYRATEEEIFQTLRRITDPLTRSWEKIERAKKDIERAKEGKALKEAKARKPPPQLHKKRGKAKSDQVKAALATEAKEISRKKQPKRRK